MANGIHKSEAEWRIQLSPEQYHVAREKGTEAAFTGLYWNAKAPGRYLCIGCGEALFDSDAKYESGTGWPSFWSPIAAGSLHLNEDVSHGMRRTEVTCVRCGSHLGHLFSDGPKPTGQRYC
ncbi:MAG: peptide-methionine (R)-S-oxide reductase MsrB, partial [Terriglobales bacterium]